jgi:hypothetical protein
LSPRVTLPLPDSLPNPDLLRSLGKLVRGLSALFWGLPIALIVCVWNAYSAWLKAYGWIPPLIATALVLYGLWQLAGFQKQERVWRRAIDVASVLGLVNLGLTPFPFFASRIYNPFFTAMVDVLAICALLFLISLNIVMKRLGAMLPDEALRIETNQFTTVNLNLLLAILFLSALYFLLHFVPSVTSSVLQVLPYWLSKLLSNVFQMSSYILIMLVLLPLAMTMALIWKTKEVILDNVFGMPRQT